MNSAPSLVLDNSILSAFRAAGWFHSFGFWCGEYQPSVSQRIWREEFLPHHDVTSKPDWLVVSSADLKSVQTSARGQLSKADWTCIGLAEKHEEGRIITNDRALREVAQNRDIAAEWGTKFAIETFERCGISKREYDAGKSRYISDTLISGDIANAVRSAEKR
jgi:hypothetical protein